ncbi:thioredoxin domain-containing protein [Candidatus Acetothermia bacterium]|nr:thioredoxin domain-containing protein [Candidatus Acetothermia bacterium]MCI2427852.1 thioredoxin domain-containing protein [Candidatus Acetothermia bacterium]
MKEYSEQELEKLAPNGGDEYNRLVFEKSPYLLQHAKNPVNWYPWGDEAFEKARQEDKPIFLSIGYSTCHWCHVMEHESFEDAAVAKLMNQVFVSIKVDREERPDIDNIYMTICQMMTGGGGWPLTIIMTPDKQPFFAGTYIPKDDRYGRLGMMTLIPQIQQIWSTRRQQVLSAAQQIITELHQPKISSPDDELDKSILKEAYAELGRRFDSRYGGFGSAPKFPSPHNLLFLLRYWQRTREEHALAMVERTLQAMRRGGVYDHVGFGFHRYSTDHQWLVPHFEKMLYDQAMLAIAYTEAYQATKKSIYAQTAREIFTYVLRDMTDQKGGFYSAEDADSEGKEGKFYLWTTDEIRQALGDEEAGLVSKVFNLSDKGNFHEEGTAELSGTNILHLRRPLSDDAVELGISENELYQRLESAREKLFEVREKRIHPYKDDKILVDWNGLMIAAFAKGAQVFNEPDYAQAAMRAADFILEQMTGPDRRLFHRYRDGEAAVSAYVDDYAFLIWGLLELYEATFAVRYLQFALDFTKDLLTFFWDKEHGGLFFTAENSEKLIARQKQIYDGAVPSGNSVAALNLLRLSRMTAASAFEDKAWQISKTFADQVKQIPIAYTQLLSALDFGFGPSFEVVIAGRSSSTDTQDMVNAIRRQFLPNKVLLFVPSEAPSPAITKIAEFTKYQTSIEGKATAYVCRNYLCSAPTTDITKILELMQE